MLEPTIGSGGRGGGAGTGPGRVQINVGHGPFGESFPPGSGEPDGTKPLPEKRLQGPVGFIQEPGSSLDCGKTVLLVEDEPLVRQLEAEVLRRHGFTVLEASNGREALQRAGQRPLADIDLLLTDMVMPEMGGRELADHLRSEMPGLKVVFTSGFLNSPENAGGANGSGVFFLSKPFSPVELVRKMREATDERQ